MAPVSQRGTHEALPQGGLCLVLILDSFSGLARWLGNLHHTNFLRRSHEEDRHQRPQEVT